MLVFALLQMALSAASPFYRGYVSDIDCRWGVISASVDDRTQEERGLKVSVRCWETFRMRCGFWLKPKIHPIVLLGHIFRTWG